MWHVQISIALLHARYIIIAHEELLKHARLHSHESLNKKNCREIARQVHADG